MSHSASRRIRFQFSLRTLLLVMVVAGPAALAANSITRWIRSRRPDESCMQAPHVQLYNGDTTVFQADR
jgi:hypothetical protein